MANKCWNHCVATMTTALILVNVVGHYRRGDQHSKDKCGCKLYSNGIPTHNK